MSERVKDWKTDYDIFAQEYIKNPFPIWDEIRDQCPVAHTERWGGAWITWSGCLFIFGIVGFSGSLYVLSIPNVRGWGAVTPIGGLALMAGWLSLAIGVWRGTAGK